jgi:hypothetical protein
VSPGAAEQFGEADRHEDDDVEDIREQEQVHAA